MSRRRFLPQRYGRFRLRVWRIVAAIPRGKVMTYGGIAGLIPKPADMAEASYRRVRARWVGYALAQCPEDLPWQRVVNAQGGISPRLGHGPHVQKLLLRREGVHLGRDGRIVLARYLWRGARTPA